MLNVSYNNGNRGAFNPLTPGGAPSPTTQQELVHEVVVIDVITNESHTSYASDGYNIGAIKYRALKGDMYREENTLNWALPLDANITEYPLINEIVMIHSIMNRFYYTRSINTTSRVTAHPVHGINEEMSPAISPTKRAQDYRLHTSEKKGTETVNRRLGKYFVDRDDVYRLRHDEGDIVFEGRSGQSIRFGASWKSGTMFQSKQKDQQPNIILRVGPDPSQTPKIGKFGLIRENIDKDASSIYMVSDQLVPITYATKGSETHAASINDFPSKLEGNQIVINTGRFIMNAKSDKIMGFSLNGIHWTTSKNFTVDTDKDFKSKIGGSKLFEIGKDSIQKIGSIYEMEAGTRASIVAPKVFIGLHEGQTEPIPCGNSLAQFLESFLDVFISNASAISMFTASPGSPSPLNPTIIAALNRLKSDVSKGKAASFNSTIAYTQK